MGITENFLPTFKKKGNMMRSFSPKDSIKSSYKHLVGSRAGLQEI